MVISNSVTLGCNQPNREHERQLIDSHSSDMSSLNWQMATVQTKPYQYQ